MELEMLDKMTVFPWVSTVQMPRTEAVEHEVPCPICKKRNYNFIRNHTDGHSFMECKACAMRFYSPRYREEYVISKYLGGEDARQEAVNMYERGVFFGEPIDSDPEKQKRMLASHYDQMLSEASGHFREINGRDPASVFEAGCSIGWFIKNAADRGMNVAGCDANAFCAEVGRNKLGLNIFGGTFAQYPITTERYDLIVALDYIEHTYRPLEDLQKLHDLGKPGSVLLLKTFLEEHDKSGAYIQPVFHPNHFFGSTLRNALERTGWKIRVFDDERERVYAQVTVIAERS